MKLRHCILSSLFLTIASILWLSCGKDDTEYCYSPYLDVRFAPITPYGALFPTIDGSLVAYVQRSVGDYCLVKIHGDGKVDSTLYSFKGGEDRGNTQGSIFLNEKSDVFIYDKDFNNNIQILRFDRDINAISNTRFSVNPDYRVEGNWPVALGDGGFSFLVQSMTEFGDMERYLYTIDSQGNLQDVMPFSFSDEYVYSASGVYRCGDTYIVQYDNQMNENTFTFLDLDGTRKATVSIPGFSLVTSYFYDNYLYALVHTSGNRYDECFSLYKFNLDGDLLTTSHSMTVNMMTNITEIGDRLFLTGYTNTPSQKQGTPDRYIGKIFSIDKETLADIDTVVMSYNTIPLSVFSDGGDGYNVFLSRKFNYDNTQYMNLNYDNIYIYNVDDLHKLQIETQQ